MKSANTVSQENQNSASQGTNGSADNIDFAASTSSQQQFPSPPPFGSFPFNMPFPPAFPPPPNMAAWSDSTGNTGQVPRFPLPFVSPFYPMMMPPGGFPPGMVPPGMIPPMVPGMPGMQVPPWQQYMMSSQSQQPSAPSTGESSNNSRETTSRPSNTTSSVTSSEPSQANIDSGESNRSSSPEPVVAEPDTIPSQSSENTEENIGLRQRNISSHVETRESPVQPASAPAELPAQTRSCDSALLRFAIVVVAMIILLILYRLKSMNFFSTIF